MNSQTFIKKVKNSTEKAIEEYLVLEYSLQSAYHRAEEKIGKISRKHSGIEPSGF